MQPRITSVLPKASDYVVLQLVRVAVTENYFPGAILGPSRPDKRCGLEDKMSGIAMQEGSRQ